MKEICKKISVDMSRKSGTRLIFTRQNDVGARKLLITLTDGGAPYIPEYDCSVSFNFKRSDMVAGAVAASVVAIAPIISKTFFMAFFDFKLRLVRVQTMCHLVVSPPFFD